MNKGFTVWLTGTSGSGKSAIAHFLGKRLQEWGKNVEILNGEAMRTNLCQGLGFQKQDQVIYLQRIAFVCKLLTRNGVAVISASISPYREARDNARKEIDDFVEVYVKCPPDVCAQRNIEEMHQKALNGEIQNSPGASDLYEEPINPELVVETDKETVEESADKIVNKLIELGYLNRKGTSTHVYSSEEEDRIKERLSRLGYI
ncbi:MAG: adenylyl-sulfate kinase [Candidatus Brocadia sp.]|jgi:adenylyl-sulfate kinase